MRKILFLSVVNMASVVETCFIYWNIMHSNVSSGFYRNFQDLIEI